MKAFFKAIGAMLAGLLKLFLSCLFNGWLAMLIINPVFHLTIGLWGWVGVVFVAIEVVSGAYLLSKPNK